MSDSDSHVFNNPLRSAQRMRSEAGAAPVAGSLPATPSMSAGARARSPVRGSVWQAQESFSAPRDYRMMGTGLSAADAAVNNGYNPPSLDKALEHASASHPRTRNDFSELVPWPVCGTNVGRFCCPKFDDSFCTVCCCEKSSASDLATYGPGLSIYFKFLKAMAWLFFLWSLAALPIMVFTSYGASSSVTPSGGLTDLTLGNLRQANESGVLNIPLTQCGDEPCKVTMTVAAEIFTYADIVGVCFFVIAFLWIRHLEKRETRVANDDFHTVADYTVHVTRVPPHATEELIKTHFERVTGHDVAAVNIAEDNTELLNKFVRRGRLVKRLDRVVELQNKARFDEDVAKVDRLQAQRDKINLQIKEINRAVRTMKLSNRALAAFVTFNTLEGFVSTYAQYGKGWWIRYLCQPRALRLKVPPEPMTGVARVASRAAAREREVRLRVKAAPPPSTIIWHNLSITWCQRMCRRTVTALISVIVLALSVGVGLLASWQQQEAQKRQQVDSTTCPVKPTVADGINCYCSKQDPTKVFEIPECKGWTEQFAIAAAVTIAASVTVVLLNWLLTYIIKKLSDFEAHHSLDAQAKSFANRLFLLQFANTAILPLVVNAGIIPGVGNEFSDFVPEWYMTVGASFTVTMILNIVAPHFAPLERYCNSVYCERGTCCGLRAPPNRRAASQRELNAWFEGPHFHLSTRYAQVLNTVAVTLLFAPGIPLLLPLAMVNMIVSFWIDKWLLLRYYRTPPHYDVTLGRSITSWLPWIIVAHLGFAAYMYSSKAVFPPSDQGVSGVSGAVNSAEFRSLSERLGQRHVIALTALALIILGLIVLSWVMHGLQRAAIHAFNFITCGALASTKDTVTKVELVRDQPSYRDSLARGKIAGIPSYNILENPEIASAVAVTQSFAKLHHRLIDVRESTLPSTTTAAENPIMAAVQASRGEEAKEAAYASDDTSAAAGAAAMPSAASGASFYGVPAESSDHVNVVVMAGSTAVMVPMAALSSSTMAAAYAAAAASAATMPRPASASYGSGGGGHDADYYDEDGEENGPTDAAPADGGGYDDDDDVGDDVEQIDSGEDPRLGDMGPDWRTSMHADADYGESRYA